MEKEKLVKDICDAKEIIMNNLPEKFEDFSEARRNSFITIKNLKIMGRRSSGYFAPIHRQR
jgi:hypothetical protein